MQCHRRDFVRLSHRRRRGRHAAASVAMAQATDDLYDVGKFGNVRLLHMTDTHAQVLPVYFREPSVNIGVGSMRGQPPHIVGGAFLGTFQHRCRHPRAHAMTYLDFERGGASLRPHGRLCPFENADRQAARGSRRRQYAAARRRRHCAGLAAGEARKVWTWSGREPARRGRDDGALGIHLRRGKAAPAISPRSKAASSPRMSS